jgi:hypothetical protein
LWLKCFSHIPEITRSLTFLKKNLVVLHIFLEGGRVKVNSSAGKGGWCHSEIDHETNYLDKPMKKNYCLRQGS